MDDATPQPEQGLIDIFSKCGVEYSMVEHPPVFTIEEALALVPPMEGAKTKNVFLRDAKGSRHFLAVVPYDKRVDMVALAREIPSSKLSMGSAERLSRHLGVTSGAVSVFSLVNDINSAVELIIDEAIWRADRIQGHPLRNTATVSISHAGLVAFLDAVGHRAVVMRVP